MDHWHWKPDPFAAFTLAVSASLYIVGMWRMRARGARIPRLESGASLAGWLILAIASAGWIFDVYEGQIFNITRNQLLAEILQGRHEHGEKDFAGERQPGGGKDLGATAV